jgi:hypothetical protein
MDHPRPTEWLPSTTARAPTAQSSTTSHRLGRGSRAHHHSAPTADESSHPLTVGGSVRTLTRCGPATCWRRQSQHQQPGSAEPEPDARGRGPGSGRGASCCRWTSCGIRPGLLRSRHSRRPQPGWRTRWNGLPGVELGAGELVVNSIDADGTRDGYEASSRGRCEAVSVPVVASAGLNSSTCFRCCHGKADALRPASSLWRLHRARGRHYLATRGNGRPPAEVEA